MHSNYSIDYVRTLPIKRINILLKDAYKHNEKLKAWDIWLVKLPHMGKNKFIPFSQFYKEITEVEVDNTSTEDVLAEVENIRKEFNARRGDNYDGSV